VSYERARPALSLFPPSPTILRWFVAPRGSAVLVRYSRSNSRPGLAARFDQGPPGCDAYTNGVDPAGAAGGNRHGYAGYEFEPSAASTLWHARFRALHSDIGRWARRDPIGYPDGTSAYDLLKDNPLRWSDLYGAKCTCSGSPEALMPLQTAPCGRDHPGTGTGDTWQLPPGVDPPFSISPPDGIYGKKVCCAMACTSGLNNPSPSVDVLGKTFCCAGRRVACTCPGRIKEKFQTPGAVDIVTECVTYHESKHLPDLDCTCDMYCRSVACSECDAFKAELSCISVSCGWKPPLPDPEGPQQECKDCKNDAKCNEEIWRYYKDSHLWGTATCAGCALTRH